MNKKFANFDKILQNDTLFDKIRQDSTKGEKMRSGREDPSFFLSEKAWNSHNFRFLGCPGAGLKAFCVC
jgi:hypothetical protein